MAVDIVVDPGSFDLPTVAIYVDREFDVSVPIAQMDSVKLAYMRETTESLWARAQALHLAATTAMDIREYELSAHPSLFELMEAA
jgi:hypothetical protein